MALIIASLFVASCKQDVSDGVTCMVNGFVYDVESKLPIEGVTVSIGNKVGVTNEEGYFVVSGVGAGTYDVAFTKEGYLPEEHQGLFVNPGQFKEVRGEDLVYYRDQIIEGEERETRISATGQYVVDVEDGTIWILPPQDDEIDSIGDATRYSQTILGIGMKSSCGVLSGTVRGLTVIGEGPAAETVVLDVPAGTGITAFYLPSEFVRWVDDQEVEPDILLELITDLERVQRVEFGPFGVLSFRTIVGEDGFFYFSNVPNGLFALAVDPFPAEIEGETFEIPQSLCAHEHYDEILSAEGVAGMCTAVTSGYGDAGTVTAVVDPAIIPQPEPFALEAVYKIGRELLPIHDNARTVMESGGGLVLWFNRCIDESYEDLAFVFTDVEYPVYGETSYVIENDYELGIGVVIVWNDSIRYQGDLVLAYSVKSFPEGEALVGAVDLDYVYYLNIADTDLYIEDYEGDIEDRHFNPYDEIEIEFDREIPEADIARAEIQLYEGAIALGRLVDVGYDIEEDSLFIWKIDPETEESVPFEFDMAYNLSFKIVSWDGVTLYSTVNSLAYLEDHNIVLVSEENDDFITFTTAQHYEPELAPLPAEEDETMTNISLDPEHPTVNFNPYEDVKIEFSTRIAEAKATLTWCLDNEPIREVPIDLIISEDETCLTISLGENEAFFPYLGGIWPSHYKLSLEVTSYEGQKWETEDLPFRAAIPEYFNLSFSNGIDDLKIESPEEVDSHSDTQVNVNLSWSSIGQVGDHDLPGYMLVKVDAVGKPDMINAIEIQEIPFTQYIYDRKMEATYFDAVINDAPNYGDLEDMDELVYGLKVGFVLVTCDDFGRLVQSPVVWISDNVAPTLVRTEGHIVIGTLYPAETAVTFRLRPQSNELLSNFDDAVNVELSGADKEKVSCTAEVKYGFVGVPGNEQGYNEVVLKLTFNEDVTFASADDLTISVKAKDSSGNEPADAIEIKPEAE